MKAYGVIAPILYIREKHFYFNSYLLLCSLLSIMVVIYPYKIILLSENIWTYLNCFNPYFIQQSFIMYLLCSRIYTRCKR